jgi:hypothetical protein
MMDFPSDDLEPVVVYMRRGASSKTDPNAGRVSPQPVSGHGARAMSDPYAAHRDFPAEWADFLKVAFRGPMMVQRIAMHFGVTEKGARKWMSGKSGCNGQHVQRAARDFPALADAMLFAAA